MLKIMRLPAQLLKRKPDTHKGDYGSLLVIGASPGLTGAVALCVQAAMRIGTGLVRVGIPDKLNSIFEIKLTEVMSLPLKSIGQGYLSQEAFSQIKAILDKVDVIALGCGAAQHPETKKLLLKVIKEVDKPLVIDADAINALASNVDILRKGRSKNVILTPHLAEFSRLIGISKEKIKKQRKELVKKFSLKYNLTLVLKGHKTLISNGKTVFENTTGNPGMATAGSGDVLTGMIAGLLAQGLSTFDAAKYGVWLHGLSADYAAKEKTQNCLIASDIIEYLPVVFKKLSRKK